MNIKKVLLTGGSGFVGSAIIRRLMAKSEAIVLNIDSLTYAANDLKDDSISNNQRYKFVNLDICCQKQLLPLIEKFKPNTIIHCAAETHVDRSIKDPSAFVKTNVLGTHNLLEATYQMWRKASAPTRKKFKFIYISTDEVYGSAKRNVTFSENSNYNPSSPYSASKAAGDHLTYSYFRTYGLPTIITHCSNNYGPYQHTEKFIPHVVHCAINRKKIPIYGSGKQIRDWIHVDDHASAVSAIEVKGKPGESYCIGSENRISNIRLCTMILKLINSHFKTRKKEVYDYTKLIYHTTDRPGHDCRYAIDASKLKQHIGWSPEIDFKSGLYRTIGWYIEKFKKSHINQV